MQRYSRIMIAMLGAFAGLLVTVAQAPRAAEPPTNASTEWTNLPSDLFGSVQGWTPKAREKFYYTSQGSEMMPYSWFLALERADSQTLFRENLERFGFLIPPASPKNPDALPLGFVEDPNAPSFGGVTEKRWVGLTCAACHTAAIAYKKQPSDTTFSTLIIDGGPTVANFGTFIHALAPAIVATLQDSDKYARFEQRVLGANPSEGNATTLKQSFTRFAAEFKRYIESSETPVPWGPGRVDAFGMIFNRVCTLALDLPQNRYAPNAPVSYPFLWNVNQQDHIQWHGEVENINPFRLLDPIDRLGRNTGEVMGVFARIDMRPGSVPGYASSVNLDGLLTLEYEMDKLKPPKWPENILGKINQQDNAQGKVLYDQYCLRCHVRITSSFQVVPIKWNQGLYPLKDVGTDPNSTVNVHSRLSMQTGRLQGQPVNIIGNKRFTGTASAQELVGNAVIGSLLHLPLNHLPNSRVIAPQIKAQVASAYTPASQPDLTKIGYEARPLHGIWATAPYLHNGSVPNLYQLLVPSAYRDPQFYVGSREYNTENVGYRSDAASGGELFDTHLDGNHNTGHDYGIGLHPDQRRQLIEYLKTL